MRLPDILLHPVIATCFGIIATLPGLPAAAEEFTVGQKRICMGKNISAATAKMGYLAGLPKVEVRKAIKEEMMHAYALSRGTLEEKEESAIFIANALIDFAYKSEKPPESRNIWESLNAIAAHASGEFTDCLETVRSVRGIFLSPETEHRCYVDGLAARNATLLRELGMTGTDLFESAKNVYEIQYPYFPENMHSQSASEIMKQVLKKPKGENPAEHIFNTVEMEGDIYLACIEKNI